MSIDQQIDQFFEPISDVVNTFVFAGFPFAGNDVKYILVWLVFAALFFTFYFGFINLRYFCHAIKLLREEDDTATDGQISRFQALATSLSGTVGLGNIAGVAVAVSLGGPGAVFWMVVLAVFSMSTKFMEVACGVKYREHRSEEHAEKISGGPMYYIEHAFRVRNLAPVGKVMAIIFAIFCIGGSIGGGNMFQANQSFEMVYKISGGESGFLHGYAWAFGVFLAFMVGIVIIGGIKSIAAVASKLVPAMAVIYMTAGFIVIGIHIENVPSALMTIVTDAFSLEAGFGGLLGSLLVGVQRAAFSNEAGLGSAAIVHSTARTKDHISQGMVGMLGPFIDTIVICLITALVIIISGVYQDANGVEGVELTSKALEAGVPWFSYVLALTVFLFAYSTLISWFYYGQKAMTYLFGEKDAVIMAYKIFYCFCVVVGASANLANVISFTDAMILSMGFPNIIGLYLLAPEIKKDIKAYIAGLKEK